MLLTLLQSQGIQPPVEPPKIFQEIWIIEEEGKKQPKKTRKAVRRINKQLKEAVCAIKTAEQTQKECQSLDRQKEALRLADKQIEISFQLLELQTRLGQLNKAAEAYQAKLRLEEYIRQEYEKTVKLYEEQKRRKQQEELRDAELLLMSLMDDSESLLMFLIQEL